MLAGHRDVDGMVREHARHRPAAWRAAEPLEGRARSALERVRAVEREGLARRAEGRRGAAGGAASRSSRSSARSRTASAASKRREELARGRAGKQFDPALAELIVRRRGADLRATSTAPAPGTRSSTPSPALALVLSDEQFDEALLAIANFVDLKSPYTLGHAARSPTSSRPAGTRLGLAEAEVRTLRRAGLVHDFGRLGVSNAIWDKPGPLGAGEWERVRLHPYLTERMLHQSAALAPLAAIAVAAPRAARRLRLSARALRRGDLATGATARRRRRLPGDARASSLPAGAHTRRSRRASCAPR